MRRVWLGVAVCALALAAACQSVTPSRSSSARSSTAATTPTTTAISLPRAHGLSTAAIKLTQLQALPGAITMATRTGDSMLYVGTQNGQIYAIDPLNPSLANHVLDLSGNVIQNGGERGLLGMTFSKDGTKLYVHYSAQEFTNMGSITTVDEYDASATVSNTMFTNRVNVLTNDHHFAGNHNGGSLLLGPESTTGYDVLYLALGDGGGGGDGGPGHNPVTGNGQFLGTLHGKILRFHPLATGGHDIPAGNPFNTPADVTAGRLREIWSYGLRNPFRMSFDKTTGDLWIGDVGQSAREEIDRVSVNDPTYPRGKAANFGWNLLEGLIDGPNATPASRTQTVRPVFDIDHNHGDCAIIGGYVYRGTAIPDLIGAYVYSDNCNGSIRGLMVQRKGATNRALGATASRPSSFGEDDTGITGRDGDLYVLSLSDGLLRIDQGP